MFKSLIRTLFFSPPKEEKTLMSLWQELLEGTFIYGNDFKVKFNIEGYICNTLSNDTPQILTKQEVPDYDHLLSLLKELPPPLAPEVLNFMKVFHYLKYSKKVKPIRDILDKGCYVSTLQATAQVLELKSSLNLDYEPKLYQDRINNYIGTFLYNYLDFKRLEPYYKIHKERREFNSFLDTGKVKYEK